MKTLTLVLLGFFFSLLAQAIDSHPARPNIIFIMSDDHAAHAISAYGSKINQTPNIDRIGKEGMRFSNCFAVNAICTPSRATILTGKYSHINGVPVFNRFDGSQWTVAKELQKAGYHTGMIGKWHLGSEPTGFDYWNILPGQGRYHHPLFIEMGKTNKFPGGYATDLIADFSIDFMEKRPKDKPFFLMCHHKAPHRPWEPDAKHAKLFENVEIPEPETFNDDYKNRSSAATEAEMRIDRDLKPSDVKQTPPTGLSEKELKHWKYERYMRDYLACIASVDDNVGRLLDYLDKNDLSKNTIIIYTSDQGFFLGDHNWFDKRFMYEESLRMPFLIRYPDKIKSGKVNESMILNVDFAPTFLEYAGLKAPGEVQGRSIVPLLNGENPKDWRTSMYYRYYHYPADHRVQPHYGVRNERYKLIFFNRINQWELFDLQKDPHELRSVYNDAGYIDVQKKMIAELKRLRTELNDQNQFADIQK